MLTQLSELSQHDHSAWEGLTRSGLLVCGEWRSPVGTWYLVPCTLYLVTIYPWPTAWQACPCPPCPPCRPTRRHHHHHRHHHHPSGRRSASPAALPWDCSAPPRGRSKSSQSCSTALTEHALTSTERDCGESFFIHWAKTVMCPLFLDTFNGNSHPSVQLRQHQKHQPHLPTHLTLRIPPLPITRSDALCELTMVYALCAVRCGGRI